MQAVRGAARRGVHGRAPRAFHALAVLQPAVHGAARRGRERPRSGATACSNGRARHVGGTQDRPQDGLAGGIRAAQTQQGAGGDDQAGP
jgi:hypothetical protein